MTTTPVRLVTFMGLAFETTDDVLVPRAETELLARAALEILSDLDRERADHEKGRELGGEEGDGSLRADRHRVIDMCSGSGNLACALAHVRTDIRVWASDLTDPCVLLAGQNVTRHDLGGRVEIRQGDLFESLSRDGLEGTIDLVVCNPPYISTGKLMGESAHLLDGERRQPREAFDAGPYGLAIHRRVIRDAPRFLKPGGWLAMEIGLGQDKQIEGLLSRSEHFEALRTFHDERGSPRVVAARRMRD